MNKYAMKAEEKGLKKWKPWKKIIIITWARNGNRPDPYYIDRLSLWSYLVFARKREFEKQSSWLGNRRDLLSFPKKPGGDNE